MPSTPSVSAATITSSGVGGTGSVSTRRRTLRPWCQHGKDEKQCKNSGAMVDQSITVRAMAGGSRPARSQPAAVAASGTPATARAR
jgi:hypothetical protein